MVRVSAALNRLRSGTRLLSDRTAVLIAAGVAIGMRLVLLLSYPVLLSSDSGDYLDLAHRLASGNFTGWQARRTPGYPVLLLAVHYSLTATWCVQAALGVLGTLLVYALIRLLGAGTAPALAGALIYGASLEVMALERVVLTEALMSFLLLAAAVICVMLIRQGRVSRSLVAVASALLMVVCLTRPDALGSAVVLGLATAGYLAVHQGAGAPRRRKMRAFAITSAALLAPTIAGLIAWSAFNAHTTGQFTTSSVIGYNMIDHVGPYVSPEPGADHTITSVYARTYRSSPVGFPSYAAIPEIERLTGLQPAQIGSRYLRIALRLALAHPLGYISSSMRQWVQEWRQPNYANGFANGPVGGFTRVLWGIERPVQILLSAFFLALCGICVIVGAKSRRWPLAPANTVIMATILVGTLVAGFVGYTDPGRYAYPYLVLVICASLASAGSAVTAARRLRGWSRAPIWVSSRDV